MWQDTVLFINAIQHLKILKPQYILNVLSNYESHEENAYIIGIIVK